jgi:hypothetical protein
MALLQTLRRLESSQDNNVGWKETIQLGSGIVEGCLEIMNA